MGEVRGTGEAGGTRDTDLDQENIMWGCGLTSRVGSRLRSSRARPASWAYLGCALGIAARAWAWFCGEQGQRHSQSGGSSHIPRPVNEAFELAGWRVPSRVGEREREGSCRCLSVARASSSPASTVGVPSRTDDTSMTITAAAAAAAYTPAPRASTPTSARSRLPTTNNTQNRDGCRRVPAFSRPQDLRRSGRRLASTSDGAGDAFSSSSSPWWAALAQVHILVFYPETEKEAIYTNSRRSEDFAANDFVAFESVKAGSSPSISLLYALHVLLNQLQCLNYSTFGVTSWDDLSWVQ